MQHSDIGGFGKWDGVLILYHGLITKMVYCTALKQAVEMKHELSACILIPTLASYTV